MGHRWNPPAPSRPELVDDVAAAKAEIKRLLEQAHVYQAEADHIRDQGFMANPHMGDAIRAEASAEDSASLARRCRRKATELQARLPKEVVTGYRSPVVTARAGPPTWAEMLAEHQAEKARRSW